MYYSELVSKVSSEQSNISSRKPTLRATIIPLFPIKVAIVVLDDSSILSLAALLEPFNQLSRLTKNNQLFSIQVVPATNKPLGDVLKLDESKTLRLNQAKKQHFDAIFILNKLTGYHHYQEQKNHALLLDNWLKKLVAKQPRMILGELCCHGFGVLAALNFINLPSTHKERGESEINVTTYHNQQFFEVENNRYCAHTVENGSKMILEFMQKKLGYNHNLITNLYKKMGYQLPFTKMQWQEKLVDQRLHISQPKLVEALALMEANIEEPLSTDDIATHVGISIRHLERLFARYMDMTPSCYYRKIRMAYAQQLLQQSQRSILQISLACGFSSAAHFSTSYRNHYGITPSEERFQCGNRHMR